MPVITSFNGNEVYEVGAGLLALLADPLGKSEGRLIELRASLCAQALWNRFLANPNDTTPITVKPQSVFRETSLIDRHTKMVAKRLGERLVAARMVMPFLLKAELGRTPDLPVAMKRLSINQAAELVLEDAGQSDVGNVKTRFWIPSKPVIYLAAAAAIIGQERRKRGIAIGLEDILLCRELIEDIIRRAQIFEGLIAKEPGLHIRAGDLIQVRLV